jgi:hypothetical protein
MYSDYLLINPKLALIYFMKPGWSSGMIRA